MLGEGWWSSVISLEQSWARAWDNLQLQPLGGLFSQLVAAYNEPHRHYHTEQHLRECLSHFSESISNALHPGEIEIALWFHDSVYDLQSKDNERRSAEWAVQMLAKAGAIDSVKVRVADLIMATRHDAVPSALDQMLLVDIDLAILGSSPERFGEYDHQIKSEYSWVPDFIYRMKRKDVLKEFLARKSIYSTSHFRERFEAQARANLTKVAS